MPTRRLATPSVQGPISVAGKLRRQGEVYCDGSRRRSEDFQICTQTTCGRSLYTFAVWACGSRDRRFSGLQMVRYAETHGPIYNVPTSELLLRRWMS